MLQELINQTLGQYIEVTGPDSRQCTAVPHKWQQMLGLPIVYGNARDTFNNAPDDLYDKAINTPTNYPRPGAVIVWDAPWGRYVDENGVAQYAGHTGVVVSANPDTFDVLEQNNGDNGLTHVATHNYGNIIGWFYPRVLDQPAPAPEPAPAPIPEPTPAPLPEPVREITITENSHTDLQYIPMENSVTIATEGANVRELPSTNSADNQGTGNLDGGVDVAITGVTRGQNIDFLAAGGKQTDLWFRTIHGNWIWAGAIVVDLNFFNNEAIPFAAPVYDTTPTPNIPVPPPITPEVKVEATGQNSAESLPITVQPKVTPVHPGEPDAVISLKVLDADIYKGNQGSFVMDYAANAPVEFVPANTVLDFVSYVSANGINYFQTKNLRDSGKPLGINGLHLAYPVNVNPGIDSLSSESETPLQHDLENVSKFFKGALGALDFVSGKKKESK